MHRCALARLIAQPHARHSFLPAFTPAVAAGPSQGDCLIDPRPKTCNAAITTATVLADAFLIGRGADAFFIGE
jgi:hypothetical protein